MAIPVNPANPVPPAEPGLLSRGLGAVTSAVGKGVQYGLYPVVWGVRRGALRFEPYGLVDKYGKELQAVSKSGHCNQATLVTASFVKDYILYYLNNPDEEWKKNLSELPSPLVSTIKAQAN